MEFTQKKFFEEISFRFESDGFAYHLKDRSSTTDIFVKYDELNFQARYTTTKKNEYFRNVGYIWLILGAVFTFPSMHINFWVYVGAICLVIYYVSEMKFTIIPFDRGSIYLIKDDQHDDIIEELRKRAKNVLISRYGEIDYGRTFEDERKKYKAMLDTQLIGESEFNEFVGEMEKNKTRFKPEV
jgi:hypothetical protein